MIVQTNIKGDYLPMNIIAQFIENLNILNKNTFLNLSNLEPLALNNAISKQLESLIDNPELNELLNQANSNAVIINNMLTPIAKVAKDETVNKRYPLKEIPYANFIIDEPPIVKDHSKEIISIDFLTVPTINFMLVYVLVVIEHHRRKIIHVNLR
jgi:hypothetical protein